MDISFRFFMRKQNRKCNLKKMLHSTYFQGCFRFFLIVDIYKVRWWSRKKGPFIIKIIAHKYHPSTFWLLFVQHILTPCQLKLKDKISFHFNTIQELFLAGYENYYLLLAKFLIVMRWLFKTFSSTKVYTIIKSSHDIICHQRTSNMDTLKVFPSLNVKWKLVLKNH